VLLKAQSGSVSDNLTISSKILKSERKFALYLPPDYQTSNRSYPVLYLLHGGGDDQTGWVQFGEVLNITDRAIRQGTATPMIIVMPDASAGRMGYFNDIRGDWNYEDFFFNELIPHIEKKYRVKSDKRYRAVAGLSMGGGGTLMYALHRPEMFSSACPLSAYIGPLTLEEARARMKQQQVQIADSAIESYFSRHNAISLVNSIPDSQKKSVRWYIDCGDDDFLYEGNSLLHIAMKKKDVPHEFRIREGGHTWTYWRESLPEVLKFVSQGFHQY
jgi:enterochelin esterase-like enzyme